MNTDKLKQIFESVPEVKLAYFFGSKLNGGDGPMSDYDFAVYIDADSKVRFEVKCGLLDKIGRFLKSNKVDIAVINDIRNSELKYQIIKNGKILAEQEPYRITVETAIMNEYFDYMAQMKKHSLTKQ